MARHNVKRCRCGHRKGEHRYVEREHKGPCTQCELGVCVRYDGP